MFGTVCIALWLLGRFVEGGGSEAGSSNRQIVESGETFAHSRDQQGLFKKAMDCGKEICGSEPKPGSINSRSIFLRLLYKIFCGIVTSSSVILAIPMAALAFVGAFAVFVLAMIGMEGEVRMELAKQLSKGKLPKPSGSERNIRVNALRK